MPLVTTCGAQSPAIGSTSPRPQILVLDIRAAQNGVERLLDEFRLFFLNHEDRLFVGGENG